MKTFTKFFVLVAAAAMALASCQKNEITGPETQEVHFTIKADIAETKTYITENVDKTYTPSWSKGDKIGVLFALEENAKLVDFENTAEAGEEATFEGKHAFTVVEGASEVDGYLYAFYPSSAFNKFYSDGGVRLDLKVTQYPTSTSFDPSCDLLIAKPCYYMAEATGEDAEVVIDDMYFARMMSVLRINLNSEFLSNETVKSVSFDADGVDFTGAMKFNLATGEFVGNQSTSQDFSEVKAVYSEEDPIAVAGEKNSAYLVVAPVTIPSGTALTFTIETENYDIVKTIKAPADMEMPAGNIAVINLSIAEENCTAKVEDTSDYSGTYAIIAENSNKFYYLTNVDNGATTKRLNSAKEMASLPESGVKLDASLVWNIVKNNDGTYLIQSADNELYLDHTSGNSSVLVENVEDAVALTIKETEGKYAISYIDSNSDTRNFVKNSSNQYFAFYTSEQCGPVYFVPAEISLDPTIIVAEDDLTQSVAADATELSFAYDLKNISGVPTVTVADGATITSVSATAADGIVTITFAENEEETPKTATLILSYEGAESVSVTITQAAKAAEGGESGWISTPFANLKEGDQVVIVSTKNTDTWAMSNDKGTDSAPAGVTGVTYSNDKLTAEPAENIIWYVGVDGNNRIFYKDSSKATWLYCTATNNGMRVGTNAAKTFTFDETSGYMKHVGTSRYIGVYTTNPDWRCYTSITDNIKNQTFQFFVKEGESGGEGGGETPVGPVQLIMSDITCSEKTENSLTFTWTAVANANGYEVTCNNKTETVNSTTYIATGLAASTEYTIYVKALGDGTNYTTSEAKSQTETTTAAQGGDSTGGYTLITDISEITSGTYVIAAKVNNNYYAMSKTFASKINGTQISVTNNTIAESAATNYVVTITKSGDSYTIKSGDNYLKYSSSTNLGSQTSGYNWKIAKGTKGTFRFTSATSGRGLVFRAATYNQFGGYALSNVTASGTEYYDVELFKLN